MSNRPKNPANARNKNVLIIGGSGSGKTRFWLKPNLLQMHSSYVVTDPKGSIVIECGNALLKHGYTIKIFNTISIYVAQTLTSSFVNHFECSYLLLKPGYMYQAIELQVFDVAHHSEIHNKNLPAQPGQDYCNSYEWYHLTLGFVKAHPKTFLTQYFDEHLGCAKLALECFLSTIPLDHSVSKILPGSQVLGH